MSASPRAKSGSPKLSPKGSPKGSPKRSPKGISKTYANGTIDYDFSGYGISDEFLDNEALGVELMHKLAEMFPSSYALYKPYENGALATEYKVKGKIQSVLKSVKKTSFKYDATFLIFDVDPKAFDPIASASKLLASVTASSDGQTFVSFVNPRVRCAVKDVLRAQVEKKHSKALMAYKTDMRKIAKMFDGYRCGPKDELSPSPR